MQDLISKVFDQSLQVSIPVPQRVGTLTLRHSGGSISSFGHLHLEYQNFFLKDFPVFPMKRKTLLGSESNLHRWRICKLHGSCSSFANKGSFQDINTISQSLWNMSQAWEILRVTLSSRDFITTLRSSQSFERRIFMLMHSGLGRPFTCRSHLRLRWVRHRRSGICLHSNQLGVPVRWDKLVSLRTTKSFWKGISKLTFIAPSMGHTWSLYGFQFWKENAFPRLLGASNLVTFIPTPVYHRLLLEELEELVWEIPESCHPTLLKGYAACVCDSWLRGQCSASGMPCFVRKGGSKRKPCLCP